MPRLLRPRFMEPPNTCLEEKGASEGKQSELRAWLLRKGGVNVWVVLFCKTESQDYWVRISSWVSDLERNNSFRSRNLASFISLLTGC